MRYYFLSEKIWITFFKLIAVVLFCTSCNNHEEFIPKDCEALKIQGIIDSFPYPIRPGSSEWANLSNQDEKYDVVNVPEDILQNMCTHGLVYTCVYCPLFMNLTVFNHIRSGFTALCDNINSFAELIDRSDASFELFEYYKTLFDTTSHNILIISVQIQMYHTEIFFAQQEFIGKFDTNELQNILIYVYNKLLQKEEQNLQSMEIDGSYYLMSNILYHNLEYKPLIDFIERNYLTPFIDDCRLISGQSVDSVKYYSKKYIEEEIN
jgi:hypothetical protein